MEIENIKEKEENMSVYEVSYLLLPSLAEGQVPGKAGLLKEALTSLGGAIISLESPILIDLAYPMTKVVSTVRHKVDTGYFGWIKFEIDPSQMANVKKNLDANIEIIRYLIIKTVRENTLLEGKMNIRKEENIRKSEDEPEVEEVLKVLVPEEAIDKSIDELVIA